MGIKRSKRFPEARSRTFKTFLAPSTSAFFPRIDPSVGLAKVDWRLRESAHSRITYLNYCISTKIFTNLARKNPLLGASYGMTKEAHVKETAEQTKNSRKMA